MYGLQVRKFIVIRINTDAEKEAGIATVYNLVVPELRETSVVKRGQEQREICPPQRNWIDISDHALPLPDALLHADGAVLKGCSLGT